MNLETQEVKSQEEGHSSKRKRSVIVGTTAIGLGISIFIHTVGSIFIFDLTVFEGRRPVQVFETFSVEDYNTEEEVEAPELLIEDEEEFDISDDQSDVLEITDAAPEETFEISDVAEAASPNIITSFAAPGTSVPSTANIGAPSLDSNIIKGEGGSSAGGKIRLGNLFGGVGAGAGNVLTGTFYDLKLTAGGEVSELGKIYANGGGHAASGAYDKLIIPMAEKWDTEWLNDYYKAPAVIRTTQVAIPKVGANRAPKIFRAGKKVKPSGWVVLYRGFISPPKSGRYRFVGHADDVLAVAIKKRPVFEGSWSGRIEKAFDDINKEHFPHYTSAGQKFSAGKWIQMRSGERYPIEIIIGEIPGGFFSAWLMIQQEGEEYERNSRGYPVLPLFQTANTEVPTYRVNATGPQLMIDGLVFDSN